MTAKEAVESLMAKNPDGRNPTLKALKKAGLLNEILYGQGWYLCDDSNLS